MPDWMFPLFPPLPLETIVLFSLLVVWSTVWKGIALWRAGRNADLVWFIVLLIVNTVGILEIIYIFAVSPRRKKPTQ